MKKRIAYLTIDVDFTDYISGSGVDEMQQFFPVLRSFFEQHDSIKSTWFVRIDNQIEKDYGAADYILSKHSAAFDWLRDNGHEIGWHHHAYVLNNGTWTQNTNEEEVLTHIKRYGAVAKACGMNICRMGWGQMSSRIMTELDSLGFVIDSSAMPRPKYGWDTLSRDWSRCPIQPYHPNVSDYQSQGQLNIIEFPMTTVPISLKSDTEPGVLRYINPLYKHEYFVSAVNSSLTENIVLISHPYELSKGNPEHPLLSFSLHEFKRNMEWMVKEGFTFQNLSKGAL